MKKLILLMSIVFLLTGCGKESESKVMKKFMNRINDADSYVIKGSMEIYNEEDTYTYAVSATYKKDELYKVVLINQNNNHEQVILKNKEGVYVITPSLNKSFKFQSEWPNNSSQTYLLQALVKDINRDKTEFTVMENNYRIVASVNYPNNPDLVKEEIFIDKDYNVERVNVLNKNGDTKIKMIYKDIDYKAKVDNDIFELSSIIDEDCCNTTDSTSKMEDFIYPLYIPSNTYLSVKETVDTDYGNRNILTFNGDKNFILIEEKAVAKDELEIIPVYGDPLFINDTIGAISANSLYWTSNKIDYYLTSKDLNSEALLTIANSVGNTVSVGK